MLTDREIGFRRADLELLPQELTWVVREIGEWRRLLKQRELERDELRAGMCREVIAVLEADARQINRKLRRWIDG